VRRTRATSALLAGLLLLGACGGDDGGDDEADDPFVRETTTTTAVDDEGDDGDDDGSVGIDLDGVPVDDQDDVIIETALEEVERFWEGAFPEVYGGELEPVRGGFVA